MLTRAPMIIRARSPRTTEPNQMLTPADNCTSPVTTAPGATYESPMGCIRLFLPRGGPLCRPSRSHCTAGAREIKHSQCGDYERGARVVKTAVIIFPFDLFGSSGTASGAQLIADELREILADNRRERVRTRARAYTNKVRLREFSFGNLADFDKWRAQGRQAARE